MPRIEGSPWWSAKLKDERSMGLRVSLRMHASDQWGLLCTVVEKRSDAAGIPEAEALIARYTKRLEEDQNRRSSGSDTIRQMDARSHIHAMNGLRDAQAALERMREGTFHPSYVIPCVYDGNTCVEQHPPVPWEKWIAEPAVT